ncbi:MAG: TetR/AcrR family transcriptional regulator [Thermonemataceae bacterium]
MTEKAQKYSKKEQIVWKSIGIFRKQGYFKTSIADLSEACGIHKAHFYYYFKDKEHLLEECLTTVKKIFDKKIFILAYQEKPLKERLHEIEAAIKNIFLKYEGGCIMANSVLETAHYNPQFIPIIQSFFDAWMQALPHLYTEKYQPATALAKAEQAVQDIEGGIILMRLYKDDRFFLKALKRAKQVIY